MDDQSASGSALVNVCVDDIEERDSGYLDSGDSEHMTYRKDWFSDYKELETPDSCGHKSW